MELSPRPGTFLDIGANAGLYSLLCHLLWPEIQAIAFEPFPATRSAGEHWMRVNGVEIAFEGLALSDREGEATLYVSAKSDASNSLVEGFRPASDAISVPVTTLDAYVDGKGL